MSQTESLIIGGFIFDDMDQADLTGPFEVLSRVPFHLPCDREDEGADS
jgi:hypothetical protein